MKHAALAVVVALAAVSLTGCHAYGPPRYYGPPPPPSAYPVAPAPAYYYPAPAPYPAPYYRPWGGSCGGWGRGC